MLNKIPIDHVLFLDIETVPAMANFDDLEPEMQELWEQKTAYQRKDEISPRDFYERAGIWAEFGFIVCISVGYFYLKGNKRQFRVTTFSGEEKELLMQFKDLLENRFRKPNFLLCAHNGKEFDFPYVARRMIVHRIPLPSKLNLFGKKPWEVPHLDTMELWKFGDFKHYTSLKLLARILGIPSPKEDMDGSMVRDTYYVEKDIHRIVAYCELDVITLAQVFLRLKTEELLDDSEIERV